MVSRCRTLFCELRHRYELCHRVSRVLYDLGHRHQIVVLMNSRTSLFLAEVWNCGSTVDFNGCDRIFPHSLP